MEIADYIRVLKKRWLGIFLLTSMGVGAAAGVTLITPPRYEAFAQVFVFVSASSTVGELAQGGSFAQNQVRSYVEAVNTPRVLTSVVNRLGLEETADELARDVMAEAPLNTVNIRISVTRESASEAANIANATTSSFRAVISDITDNQVSVSVLREATVPTRPVSPNTNLNLALGALVGLSLGIGLAVVREMLDTRVRGQRDVEAITAAPIIGGIAFDATAAKNPLIVRDAPMSPRAEAFRTLRTNLQFLDVEPGSRSFVVTSSMPTEGKSTTAANLAIAVADAGARVLIIDADLRRPKLADYLGIEGAVGLTDVLIGRVAIGDALQLWGRGKMVVLTAGAVPPNPSELFGSRAMQTLIQTLEAQFDMVIIDMPPLLPVTDAALVSKMTKGALVVVAAGKTQKNELAGAVVALENAGARISGVILTMLPTKGPDAYGYGGYAYGAYGYGASQPTRSRLSRKQRRAARASR